MAGGHAIPIFICWAEQGSKSSANLLISAFLELIYMVSEISVNPLKKIGMEGGSGRAKNFVGKQISGCFGMPLINSLRRLSLLAPFKHS